MFPQGARSGSAQRAGPVQEHKPGPSDNGWDLRRHSPTCAETQRRGCHHMTNPDMLHQGILPHHPAWSKFFANLRYVVIDEIHTYRSLRFSGGECHAPSGKNLSTLWIPPAIRVLFCHVANPKTRRQDNGQRHAARRQRRRKDRSSSCSGTRRSSTMRRWSEEARTQRPRT